MKKKTFSHVSYCTDLGECKECRCHTNSICRHAGHEIFVAVLFGEAVMFTLRS